MATRPTLFPKEDKYDGIIQKYILKYNREFGTGVTFTNIKGLIAQESQFNESASRYEKHLDTYSLGLMQILVTTAEGLGYNVKTENLADPDTNIKYGMKYFYQKFKQYRTYSSAYASYNAGSVRRNDSGKLVNQYYVDIVGLYAKFYYQRDITKDYDFATLTIQQIRNKQASAGNDPTNPTSPLFKLADGGTIQVAGNSAQEMYIMATILLISVVIFIYLKKKGRL